MAKAKGPIGMRQPDVLIVYCNGKEEQRYPLNKDRKTRNNHISQYCKKVQYAANRNPERQYWIELVFND